VADRLRTLWNFGDLDASERAFRDQLERESSDEGRAEVLTQLARVEGLRGRHAEGELLLREAAALAGASPAARVRIDLERGRLLRSSGDPAGALPLFAAAYAAALEAGAESLAADAAHMAALAAPDLRGLVDWTECGCELARASTDPEVRYWLGPLLNNLGWAYHEAGELASALDAFEQALRVREEFPDRRTEIEIARYAVGRTLRGLARAGEAAAALEQAVAWAEAAGAPDGWFHEELAEDYAALGRAEDAREQARLAIPLLEQADPSFSADGERASRLRRLAGGS
jgi:tetratricopeptide (TPR) repeat protein